MLSRRFQNSTRHFFSTRKGEVSLVPNFINGVFEQSKATKWTDVINPATQEVISKVPQSTADELKRAEVRNCSALACRRLTSPYCYLLPFRHAHNSLATHSSAPRKPSKHGRKCRYSIVSACSLSFNVSSENTQKRLLCP